MTIPAVSISTVSTPTVSTPAVSIVVLNYNGLHHLHGLFAGLADQTLRDFELVLIDNGSRDGSQAAVAQLRTAFNVPTRLIANPQNVGFAAACNQGIRAGKSPFVIMLNNDTRPEPQWLEQLVTTAADQPDVGMVASKMLFAHRPDRINSAGIALDWTGIAWDWRGGEEDDPAETDVQEVFGPCGGAGLYTRALLEQIGGFDDDFFAYLEDVDLAWRARLAGWRCLYQPRARVLHAHSATSGEGSPFKSFLLGRNKVWLLAKNYPQPWLNRYLPEIVGYDLMASLYGVATRGDAALMRGRLAALAALPRFMAKRRAIQSRWHDVDNWRRLMQPVVPPWAVSQRYTHLAAGMDRPA
ncbi:MAG: glycosyltransferase family 2 protein [Caldilineaceae bacterium]|nr:glycosyltransferase family 2 protein [Caldilineaceae bacterium]